MRNKWMVFAAAVGVALGLFAETQGTATSGSTALDLSTGTVTYALPAETVVVEYGSLYGDVEDGTAQFRVNGEVMASGGTAAATSWQPTEAGTYTLEHRMVKNGSPVGTTLTVTHVVTPDPTKPEILGTATSSSAALDLSTGTVTYALPAETVVVEYGSLYGDVEDGTAQFRVNGEVMASGGTAATTSWQPTEAGTYTLEHRMVKNGSPVGTTLSVTHIVTASVVVATVGEYVALDLEDDLGVVIDADWRAGDTVTIKTEGLANGLSLVPEGATGPWTLSGVPSETAAFATQPMFVRVTVTYKDRSRGKSETLQQLPLEIRASDWRVLSAGVLGAVYEPIPIAELWPEVADAAVHPKDWTIKGWPSGLTYKNGILSGVPKKAGTFTLTATYKYKPLGETKTVSEKVQATMTVWADEDEQSYRYTDQVGVATTNTTLGADVKSVSGLPSGIKFAKGVVSGTPKKAGVFAVTLTLSDKSKETFLWLVLSGENTGVLTGIDWQGTPGVTQESSYVTMMQGAVKEWSVPVPEGAKVSVSGLPSGLRLVQDRVTGEWSVSGTPTKAGSFTVTFKTARNNVTVTERIAFVVTPNEWTGSWYGIQDAAYDKSSVGAIVTVAAGGSVKLILTESALKTTVSVKNLDVAGTSATFVLPRNRRDPSSIDRVAVMDFAAERLTIDGVTVAEMRPPVLLPLSDGTILTYVFETDAGGESLEPYAYVSATYNARSGMLGLSGKLADGTSIAGTTYAVLLDEETTVFAPVFVTDKDKRVISFTLGDRCRVIEDGITIPIGKGGAGPSTGVFAATELKGKKFGELTSDENLVIVTGEERTKLAIPDRTLNTAVSAKGLVRVSLKDDEGLSWTCELVPVTEADEVRFRGIASGTVGREKLSSSAYTTR